MNYSSMLKESIESQLADYDNMDFYEVFIKSFRKWSSEKLSQEENDLPFSYLLNKYGTQFVNDLLGPNNTYSNYFSTQHISFATIAVYIGKELVKKGLQKLPSFRKDVFFMNTYGKYLKRFINNLTGFDWVQVSIEEKRPFDLEITLKYDYDKFLKQGNPGESAFEPTDLQAIKTRIRNFITDTLGLQIGNPIHGGVKLYFIEETNVDEWVKKVLNGVIKKDIKKIENADKIVRSIRFEPRSTYADLKLFRKTSVTWAEFRPFKVKVQEYLKQNGYNKINVEH